jgi:tetratricopeptide (TPR) repeat protein
MHDVSTPSQSAGLQHVVFLERAVQDPDAMPEGFGKAAFLVLRLVDLVGAPLPGRPATRNEMFGYQAAATSRYCTDNLDAGPSTELLLDLVRSATYAHRRQDPGLVAPAMIALAAGLDGMACYEESLDVLRTLERVARTELRPTDAVMATMRIARVERELGRYDLAEAAYARAGELATASRNLDAALRSRLGRANVFRLRGNLVNAEHLTQSVLADARNAGEQLAEAESEHHLGVVLGTRGELHDAVAHFWRAFQLYEDDTLGTFAMADLGVALSRLGATNDAERALRHVVSRNVNRAIVQNALIELMHCASLSRNRVGFERYRTICAKEQAQMSPNILADYLLRLGIGLARFGHFDRGDAELTQALQVAQAHHLHEFEFRIERIRAGLRNCEALDLVEHDGAAKPPAPGSKLEAVCAALTSLTGFNPPS